MSDIQDHLLITKGPRAGEKIDLSNLPITIGRQESAEVRIDVESISRKHVRISRADSGYQIEDLDSRNGTYLNEERIQNPRRIADGDQIALGPDVEMRVVIPAIQKGDATAYVPSSNAMGKARTGLFHYSIAKCKQSPASRWSTGHGSYTVVSRS